MAEVRWRRGALLSLAVTLVVVVACRRADVLGGDAADYIAAARDLTGPSRFPPGFPALLAPFAGSLPAMQAVTLAVAMLLVCAIWWAAVTVGGWRSGAVSGVLMILSPGVTAGGAAVMSDKLGALLVVAALLAVLHERPLLAGVLCAMSGWVRLVHVAFCAALPRRAWLPAGVVVAVLVAWQLVVKGSLFGYTSDAASFAVGNVTGPVSLEVVGRAGEVSNVVYFPAVLTAGFGGLFVPVLIVPAVLGLRRHWGRGARLAARVVAVNVAVYLPYFFQSARFVLPAGSLLVVYAAAGLGGDRAEVRDPVPCGGVVVRV